MYLPSKIQGKKLINKVTNNVGKIFCINDRIKNDVFKKYCKNVKCCDKDCIEVRPSIKLIGNNQNIVNDLK